MAILHEIDSTTVTYGGLALLFTAWIVSRVVEWYSLSHIKGPFLAGWTRLWLIQVQLGGCLSKDLNDVCEKYGPIVRIAPDWVVCADPEEVHKLWSVRSRWRRSSWWLGLRFDPSRDSLLTHVDPKEHGRIRSRVLPAYHGRGMDMHERERRIDEQIRRFVRLIERKFLSGGQEGLPTRPIELGVGTSMLSQDVIGAIGFSKAFGYLEDGIDVQGVLTDTKRLAPALLMSAIFPLFVTIMRSPMVKPLLPKKTDKHGIGNLLGVVDDHVRSRYEGGDDEDYNDNGKVTNSSIGSGGSIDMKESQRSLPPYDALQAIRQSGLPREEVEAEALVQLVAGTDTTAAAMRNTIFLVVANPAVYHKLQAEIDATVSASPALTSPPPSDANNLDDDGNGDYAIISDTQAASLPYLQAVLKESLRMLPPVGALAPRCSDQNAIICGTRIPAGTHVAWSARAATRNQRIFGDDAQLFTPERWLRAAAAAEQGAPETLRQMELAWGLVFGMGGKWECLGRRLAMTELGKFVFEVFRRFDVAFVNPDKPFTLKDYGSPFIYDMNAVFMPRAAASIA